MYTKIPKYVFFFKNKIPILDADRGPPPLFSDISEKKCFFIDAIPYLSLNRLYWQGFG